MNEVALEKFTNEKGVTEASRLLGCSAPAIFKALKSGRKISVLEMPDGTYTAEEIRPFPATAKKSN